MDQPNDTRPADSQSQPEKKVIIDEDWKAQVQAEKEKAAAGAQPAPSASAESPRAGRHPLPPPSLTLLATTLGMQAMMGLGMMPNPATGKPQVDLEQARHFIDTLAILQEKTTGNRTPDETAVLEDLIHQLRMGYVDVSRSQA